MFGRYLVCVKCVLFNRCNVFNKIILKKIICKWCVKNSFIVLFVGILFIKKEKKVCKVWISSL